MALKSSSVIITLIRRSPKFNVDVAVRLTPTVPVTSTKLTNYGSNVDSAILELNSN